jgi:8-oxo-dGTP pyrophosphatase MutT (NUDIX family)
MATPEFVLALREHIGHAPLWLSGVTAIVLRADEVLLVRRSDNGAWTPITGIIDPGEEPADAAAREALEEAGIEVAVERLAKVHVMPELQYGNGDRVQYLDLVFRCRWVSGEPHPADDECSDARWFPLAALSELEFSEDHAERIRAALEPHGAAVFGRRMAP